MVVCPKNVQKFVRIFLSRKKNSIVFNSIQLPVVTVVDVTRVAVITDIARCSYFVGLRYMSANAAAGSLSAPQYVLLGMFYQ